MILSKETVLITEFNLKCSGDYAKVESWYAELNGRIVAAVHEPDSSTFQVTVSDSHASFPAGTYQFNFYTDDSIGDVRKALRSGEQVDTKPVFSIPLNHGGAKEPFWLASQFIASVSALLLWWLAYTAKGKLQA